MDATEEGQEENLQTRIDVLEKQKAELIERIKRLNRRIKYKKYEKQALGPFLEQTKDVQVAPYRKQKRALEFRISTAAAILSLSISPALSRPYRDG